MTSPPIVQSTANGSPLQCLGEITASIEIGHVSKTNIRLLVIKIAILGFGSFGIDWTNKIPTLEKATKPYTCSVLNNSDHPVQLYEGTRVGELSPIKIQESTCHVYPPSTHPASPEQEPAAFDLEECGITIAKKHKLKLLLEEYRDVFTIANSDDDVGRTHPTQFHIHTKKQVPIAVKLRRTPFALRKKVNNKPKIWITEASLSPLHHLTLKFQSQ